MVVERVAAQPALEAVVAVAVGERIEHVDINAVTRADAHGLAARRARRGGAMQLGLADHFIDDARLLIDQDGRIGVPPGTISKNRDPRSTRRRAARWIC